jgi:hypothetical protein
MKTLLVAVSAVALSAILNLSTASAAQYSQPSAGAGHWEWQYHYVGHHPDYKAGWVWVK